MLTQRRKGAKTTESSLHLSLSAPPRLRVSLLAFCVTALVTSANAADIDPIKIALLVDGMATRGSGYEAAELHALGAEGLAAVLNHLLPDTAPPAPPMPQGPPEHEIRRLIERLDADEFTARESATQ